MAKIMTQLDILSKNVMGADARGVSVVGVEGTNPEEMKFETLYNEEVNYLANQGSGYRSNYPRQGGNQSWARDEGWKDRDREWRDCNPNWKDGEKDRCVPPHERKKPKDSDGGRSKLGKVLKEYLEASNRSSWQIVDKFGGPDLSHRLTQDIFKVESVKLDKVRNLSAYRPPGWRSRWRPPLGFPHELKALLNSARKSNIRRAAE
uniref:Integrase core domain containing protein n=1 Tax=Solanum tuberosum TaxID=4113 RepID=M1DWK2_SOLTU